MASSSSIRGDREIARLYPEKRNYFSGGMPMTEAAIDAGFLRDIYISLGEPVGDKGDWALRVYYKPYVRWIWLGCILMALGGTPGRDRSALSHRPPHRRPHPSAAPAATA